MNAKRLQLEKLVKKMNKRRNRNTHTHKQTHTPNYARPIKSKIQPNEEYGIVSLEPDPSPSHSPETGEQVESSVSESRIDTDIETCTRIQTHTHTPTHTSEDILLQADKFIAKQGWTKELEAFERKRGR